MQRTITTLFSVLIFFSISSSAGQFDFLVGVWSPSPACSTIRLGEMGATAPIVVEKVSDTELSVKICKGSTFSNEKKICEILGKGTVSQIPGWQILRGSISFNAGHEQTNLQVRGRPRDATEKKYSTDPWLDERTHSSSAQTTDLILTVQTTNPSVNDLGFTIGNCATGIVRR